MPAASPSAPRRSVRWSLFGALAAGSAAPASLTVVLMVVAADVSWTRAITVVLIAVMVFLPVVLFVTSRLDGIIAAPLGDLRDAIGSVAAGRFDDAAAEVARLSESVPVELVVLATAMRNMVDSLQASGEQLERNRRELSDAINQVGRILQSTNDRSTIIDVVLDNARVATRAGTAVFFEQRAGRLDPRTIIGDGTDIASLATGAGVAGLAASDGEPITFPDRGHLADREPAVDTALAVPLRDGSRLFGVVALYGRTDHSVFDADDEQAVANLASQAAAAIANTIVREELERLAVTDGLTSLWNQRQFKLASRQEIERSIRFNDTFGLLMVDIDHFKRVNDEHPGGHLAGDSVLVEVAQRLKAATREVDLIARYGGEEFALILPRTDLDGAVALAEKVRAQVADDPFDSVDPPLDLTVSVGVAVFPRHGHDVTSLFSAADAALFSAKRGGRNQVVVAPDVDAGDAAMPPSRPGSSTEGL